MAVLISYAHAKCYFAFEQLVIALQHPVRDFGDQLPVKDVQEEFDKYKIWAGNVGAAHSGKRYEISLDYRLREASFFKDQVLSLLKTLDEKVTNATSLVRGERKPFEENVEESDSEVSTSSTSEADEEEEGSDESPWEISSDSSQDTDTLSGSKQNERKEQKNTGSASLSKPPVSTSAPSKAIMRIGRVPSSEMPRLLESIKFTIACLYRVPIRKPAPLDRLKHKTSLDTSCYQHFDSLYIQDKFPGVSAELAARLGKMNTRRRQILYYREAHKESLDTARVQPKVAPVPDPAATSFVIEGGGELVQGEVGSQATPSRRALSQAASSHFTLRSKATTVRPGEVPMPAIEGHIDPTALYAPSVAESKSSMASSYSGKDLRVEVPPRPKGEDGNELEWFECPYCLITKNITTEHRWKKHVFEDLQPYVCTYGDCDLYDHFFESRDAWFQHEALHHRSKWFCNTDSHSEYESKEDFLSHMKFDHGQKFDEAQFSALKDMFRRPSRSIEGTCNLCQRHSTKLKSHLSRHLQQVALFALPRVNETVGSGKAERDTRSSRYVNKDDHKDDEDEESSDDDVSSKSVGDNGTAGANVDTSDLPDVDDDYEAVSVPDDAAAAAPDWDHVTNKFSKARDQSFRNLKAVVCYRNPRIAYGLTSLLEALHCIPVFMSRTELQETSDWEKFDVMFISFDFDAHWTEDVAQHLRAPHNTNADTPIVAVLGVDLPSGRFRNEQQLWNETLSEPFTRHDVEEKLRRLCDWEPPPPGWTQRPQTPPQDTQIEQENDITEEDAHQKFDPYSATLLATQIETLDHFINRLDNSEFQQFVNHMKLIKEELEIDNHPLMTWNLLKSRVASNTFQIGALQTLFEEELVKAKFKCPDMPKFCVGDSVSTPEKIVGKVKERHVEAGTWKYLLNFEDNADSEYWIYESGLRLIPDPKENDGESSNVDDLTGSGQWDLETYLLPLLLRQMDILKLVILNIGNEVEPWPLKPRISKLLNHIKRSEFPYLKWNTFRSIINAQLFGEPVSPSRLSGLDREFTDYFDELLVQARGEIPDKPEFNVNELVYKSHLLVTVGERRYQRKWNYKINEVWEEEDNLERKSLLRDGQFSEEYSTYRKEWFLAHPCRKNDWCVLNFDSFIAQESHELGGGCSAEVDPQRRDRSVQLDIDHDIKRRFDPFCRHDDCIEFFPSVRARNEHENECLYGRNKDPPASVHSKPESNLRAGETSVSNNFGAGKDVTLELKENDLVIVVMGPVDSGKSQFVSLLAEDDGEIMHGDDFINIRVCPFRHERQAGYFLNIPSYDDSGYTESEWLRVAAYIFGTLYHKLVNLAGIIYMQPIHHVPLSSSELRGITMLKDICGEANFANVILGTTRWDAVDEETGVKCERELRERFGDTLLHHGSKMFRHMGTHDSAMQIMVHMMRLQHHAVLDIQRQMIDEGHTLEYTSAGRSLLLILDSQKEDQERQLRLAPDSIDAIAGSNEEQINRVIRERIRKLDFDKMQLKIDFERLRIALSQVPASQTSNEQQTKPVFHDGNSFWYCLDGCGQRFKSLRDRDFHEINCPASPLLCRNPTCLFWCVNARARNDHENGRCPHHPRAWMSEAPLRPIKCPNEGCDVHCDTPRYRRIHAEWYCEFREDKTQGFTPVEFWEFEPPTNDSWLPPPVRGIISWDQDPRVQVLPPRVQVLPDQDEGWEHYSNQSKTHTHQTSTTVAATAAERPSPPRSVEPDHEATSAKSDISGPSDSRSDIAKRDNALVSGMKRFGKALGIRGRRI